MCTDDNTEFPDDTPKSSEETSLPTPEDLLSRIGSRRNFLKAAALGSAAAALAGRSRGGGLGPQLASAETLANVNCTANDVRISGPGIIVNEPCDCDETFTAKVQFTINNNTGTDRYCVTVHFCPGANGFDPGDVIIGTVAPGVHVYEVEIPNYPCGSGLVCFGAAGSGEDGGFAKGETCPIGQCCTVISWNVVANDACPQPHNKIIKSKCRAQQVCIKGRGGATLDCDTGATGVQSSCEVDCGGDATLRLCYTGDASFGPFTFNLYEGSVDPANLVDTATSSDLCHDFLVEDLTEDTTFVGTITDNTGCVRESASVTLTVEAITVGISGPTSAGCSATGSVSFTATATGTGTFTYFFSLDGVEQAGQSSNVFTYAPSSLSEIGVCHTVSVRVVSSTGCEATAPTPVTFEQCIDTRACS